MTEEKDEPLYVGRAEDGAELALHPTNAGARAFGRLNATGIGTLIEEYWAAEEKLGTEPALIVNAFCQFAASMIGSVIFQTAKPGGEDAAIAAAAAIFRKRLKEFVRDVPAVVKERGWL